MAITTSNGKIVKFLGFPSNIRMGILKELLGLGTESSRGAVIINSARQCWLGLSSTDPASGEVSEPTSDANYSRVKIGADGTSEYLSVTDDGHGYSNGAIEGDQKEIKFNRSLGAWDSCPYFVLYDAKTNGTLLAWGELVEPIVVTAKDTVPLFEDGKFRLYFPSPNEVEGLVDAAAE